MKKKSSRLYRRISFSLDKGILKEVENFAKEKNFSSLSRTAEYLFKKALGIGRIKQAIILAGGKGTRLRPFTYEVPKPLLPIKGKPIIEHSILLLRRYGVEEIIISVGYLGEKIKAVLGNGERFGLELKYIEEKKPLNTAGPLVLAKKYIKGPFFLFWADILADIDLEDMAQFHRQMKSVATMALATVENVKDLGVVELEGGWVRRFLEKPKKGESSSRLINAGVALFEAQIFNYLPKKPKPISIEKEVYPRLVKAKKLAGYPFPGAWFDTGTVERYEEAVKKWDIKI
ncbi:nucleotidyltransferase family protein [bacterium]|nr:nucleotidyltransferase family protein [bacterium]